MLSGLTYNVQFGQQIDKIVDWLIHVSPSFDIICLQEFPFSYLTSQAITPLLAHYDSYDALAFNKKKEAYGQLTLINRKKMHVVHTNTLFLGTSFLEEHVLGFSGGRSALFTKLSFQDTPFLLVNTHLVAYGTNKQRRTQLATIAKQFEHVMYKDIPVIVLGDFNYSSLVGQRGLIELMQSYKLRNAYSLSTHKLLKIKEQQVDYLFYKNISVTQPAVLSLPFSDHRPVTFTVEL